MFRTDFRQYNYFLSDNLDSWCSAVTFEVSNVYDIESFEDEVEDEEEINRRIFLQ